MTELQRRIARARLLRRQGKTYDEIRAVIGPVSDDRLQNWMVGIPRPPETRRARRRDDLRRECRRLRAQGLTYDEIAEKTGASTGSMSLWLRGMPGPDRSPYNQRAHLARIQPMGAEGRRRNAAARRDAARDSGASMIADVRSRDLFVAGITLYWAEGSKDKPWRRTGRVILINSDPDVLRLFLAWLDLLGVAEQDRHYRLSIHQSADARWHEQWWAEALAIPLASFARATLKKHKPITVRYNVGGTYHGCLIVTVLRSRHLYDVIDGAWRALVEQVANGVDSAHWSRSGPP